MGKVYGYKYTGKKQYINVISIGIFYFFHVWVNLFHIGALNIAMELIVLNILGYSLFKPKRGKVFINAMYQYYLLSFDLIMTGLFGYLYDMKFTVIQVNDLMIIAISLTYTIILLTYRKVIKLFKYDYQFLESLKARIFSALTIIWQFGMLVFINLFMEEELTNPISLIMIFYISVVNVGLFYFMLYDQKNTEIEMKEKIYDLQYVTMYDILNMRYTRVERLNDILCSHLQNKRPETEAEINKYLEKLRKDLKHIMYRYECGNQLVNILVNTIIIQSELKEIKLNENVEVINWDFIKKEDLTSTFGNLMFNAIEIVSKLEKKEMEISAKRKGRFVIIKVINTCDPSKVQFTKNNTKAYQSDEKFIKIRTNFTVETIEKLNGDISFEVIQDKFIAKICLPMFKLIMSKFHSSKFQPKK